MHKSKYGSAIVSAALFGAFFCHAVAEEIRVAAASNISVPMQSIAAAFESNTFHKVLLSFGSTGKHYAQIRHGAPFDLFFAADEYSPGRLVSEGLAVPATRFTYAVGHLVLWSRDKSIVDSEGRVLAEGAFERLAMANPKHAPYGRAAREVLESLGTWDALQKQIVRGENVAQAFQFVATGNAEIGLIAYSQILRPNREVSGSWWLVPESMYKPIRQQAVLIHDRPAARRFLKFVAEPEPQRILGDFGYGIPLEQSTRNAD
jgi:molybdate transport system substrate-binding protein